MAFAPLKMASVLQEVATRNATKWGFNDADVKSFARDVAPRVRLLCRHFMQNYIKAAKPKWFSTMIAESSKSLEDRFAPSGTATSGTATPFATPDAAAADDLKVDSAEDDEPEDEEDHESGDDDEEEVRDEKVPETYYGGYDAEMHKGWRCVAGRPPTEKEFSGNFKWMEGEADEAPVTCVFTDGWQFVLAGLTVGMLKAKEKAMKPQAGGSYWSSDDGQWQVRVKADRERLAFLKGPGKSSQLCQIKVKLLRSEEEACELIKTIAKELIAETLLNTKETIYKRRDQLVIESLAPQVMKKPSAAPSKAPAASVAPTTPPAKRPRPARAAVKAHGTSGFEMGGGFSADALAGMDESTCHL
jgi:hypothetical protein